MKAALVALALCVGTRVANAQVIANGERTVIDVPDRPLPAGVPRQISSRIIFLHRCPVGGCLINPGDDDSRVDTSSLASQPVNITGFTQSDDVWNRMLACVQATFAPFDVVVTDVDPGNVPHFENIVGGHATQLDPSLTNAIGVARKTCTELPNAVTYTFDAVGPDPDSLCWTASQEIAHGFGLEHEYNANDPLTYLGGGPSMKRFQAAESSCGTYSAVACTCGRGDTQSSYAYLLDLFGPGIVEPPTVAIKLPRPGKTVTPGFHLTATATDDVAIDRVELFIDGMATGSIAEVPPYLLKAPLDLAPGPHQVDVIAYDVQSQSATASLEVDVGPPCTASEGCATGDACVMNVCLPGPGTPGGIGSVCDANTECLSNQCASNAGEKQCVEACDVNTPDSCPGNFECLPAGEAGVCWKTGDGGGCCDAGSQPAGPMLLGLGVVALLARRRRKA